jgi:uncharacterized protein YggE
MLRYALLLLPVLALAQTPPNSVTVTASRNTNVAPDQAVISVSVNTSLSGTMDDAIAALQGSGITAANFTGVSTVQTILGKQSITELQWSFSLVTDLTALKTTTATLTGVQQAVAARNNGLSVSFSVQGTQVSQKQSQSQPCSLQDLMSDARSQASKLASAAGMTVGPVLAVSGGTTSSATSAGANAFTQVVAQPVCSLTVKFALTGGF